MGGVSLLMARPTVVLRSLPEVWLGLSSPAAAQSSGPFGFAGGWAGFLSYEAGVAGLGLGAGRAAAGGSALLAYYPCCLAIDHRAKRMFGVGRGAAGDAAVGWWARQVVRLRRGDGDEHLAVAAPRLVDAGPSRREFAEQVRQVQAWIRQGEVYVANLTYRAHLSPIADPAGAYGRLRAVHPAPYAALLRDGPRWLLSSSPELLLARRGSLGWTRPIKGTCAAGLGAAARLRSDPKERAELAMIVDMERNDLGRSATVGTVRVRDLFDVERHPGLYHLVATVEARTPGPAGDLLRAMLPGGSVTGAPKRRAVELLAALERTPRGVYTGTLGYCDDSGDMEWNLAIRTLECGSASCVYGTGGGITADSDPIREYEETRLKMRGPLSAIGTVVP